MTLGFNLEGTFEFQLVEVEAPEVVGKQACAGKEAKRILQDLLKGADSLTVRPTGQQTGAGRWWAHIYVSDADGKGFCVNEKLTTLETTA